MPASNTSPPSEPWTLTAEDVLEKLQVDPQTGLTPDTVKSRRKKFGRNRLREAEQRSAFSILIAQFKSIIIGLLALAAIASFFFGQWVEGIAIAVAIIVNTAIGFVTELKAVRSMDALRELSRVTTVVRRDGSAREIPAEQLVVGDIVLLDGGDIVTADIRLIEASKMQVDESALTGESVPVSKNIDPVESGTPLAERRNMLYKGTAVTRGSGEAVVVAVGMRTELGNISELVRQAEDEATPLEEHLDRLGRNLVWVTLALTAVVAGIGIARGKDTLLMIESAVALAVAAVPEGLPIVATIALARGMMRMARRNALINRLASVETLGATSIICTDKTGTLTENEMTVTRLLLDSGEIRVNDNETQPAFRRDNQPVDPDDDHTLTRALEIAVLCNNADLRQSDDSDQNGSGVGDPVEIALLQLGRLAGMERPGMLEQHPEEREEAFDSDTKMMATFNRFDNTLRVLVKGAPEAVLEHCRSVLTADGPRDLDDKLRDQWNDRNVQMAEDGLRVLALATGEAQSADETPYQDLSFVGLVGFLDPPRDDVADAIDECRRAGIRVIMVTGDQALTARNVARAVRLSENDDITVLPGKRLHDIDRLDDRERAELINTAVFARVSPSEKLQLISLHQGNGSIVAMTGDGVNDAPALKKADIGVAMGQRGTQVAREAADMILKDDAFATIVTAVEQGRVIFGNIRKFVLYLLSGNVAEIFAVAAASLADIPLPLLPLQILFLNFVLDVFPALALGVGEGYPNIMQRPPRDPEEPVLARSHWIFIGGFGALIAVSSLGGLGAAIIILGMSAADAVTVSFLALAFGRLWHVFNMRSPRSHILYNEITRNKWVLGALALCSALLVLAVHIPGFSGVLGLAPPGIDGWIVALLLSLLPVTIGQVLKAFGRGGP